MDKANIFIGSSEKTLRCAEMLRDELNDTGYCEARTWKQASRATGAPTRIETLERWTKEFDFAVIIFSEADILPGELGEGLKTRDDCVFEAGLFMASIGRSRCVLLSGVTDKNRLPSDLGGIIPLNLLEPVDFGNFDQCQTAIQIPAGFLKIWIQREMGIRVANRPLSYAALLKRQQKETAGELEEDQVVVASIQPLELGYESARQVRQNMDDNISYVYFFAGNTDAADKIPHLLQLVLFAPFLKKEDDPFKSRGEIVKAHRDEIVEALKDICLNDKLNIFFREPSVDLEYCIHNAASDKVARLYLKHGDEFIEWDSGLLAYQFSGAVRKKNGVNNQKVPEAVFHAAPDFELEDSFLKNMEMGMRKYFAGLGEELMKLCLEGPRET